jgi:HSP20 family molecular chaperone IbpA
MLHYTTTPTDGILKTMEAFFENTNSTNRSRAEIKNTDTGYQVCILLPGFTKEEVEVKSEGSNLIIFAETERELPHFASSRVKKTYEVKDLDPDSITAKLEAGILTVEFSNSAKKNSKKIEIL